jgi:calcineurin-like phosphoesterase family protein
MSRRFYSIGILGVAAALLAASVGSAQTVTRGPYLQSVSPTAVTVRWRTDVATGSRVDLGDSPGVYSRSVSDPTLTTEHEMRLTGLLPGHHYAYGVGQPSALLTPPDATYAFGSAPVTGSTAPVRVWVVGDSGHNNPGAQAVRNKFESYSASRPPDLWLMLGDNAYSSGTDAEYQDGCFNLFPVELRKWPLFPTRGNHDVVSTAPNDDYYDFFTMPSLGECGGVPSGSEAFYSYNWGNVHFICLDSEGSDRTLGGPMIMWLRQDLAATNAAWVVCYWHHPPYSNGSHNSDDCPSNLCDMRQNVVPILDSTGVDLVLSGHSHGYERSYLLNGHYGLSNTLTAAMKVGSGDGRVGGSGPYTKSHTQQYPFEGAVYTVAGSGSEKKHVASMPCMVASITSLGSLVLDFNGNRLDAHFLDDRGAVLDSFAIVKGGVQQVSVPPAGSTLSLAPARPTPARGGVALDFTLSTAGPATLDVYDPEGRRIARLADGMMEAGPHHAVWRGAGRDRPAAPGAYWAMLTAGSEVRVRRVVLTP